MKGLILGISFCMIFFATTKLTGQNYKVQVATYETGVTLDHFSAQGLDNVTQEIDYNGFFRYYIRGKYATQSEAIQAQEHAISKGFDNAQVIDLKRLREECSSPCAMGNLKPKAGDVVGMIFFDFDKYFLRKKSKSELDELYNMLTNNPEFNVTMVAHTDSKGTDDYNINLSDNRGKSARTYLIGRGIDPARITTEVKGESSPIAKNATTEGKDLPEGRQYNRRVEFVLKDADNQIRTDLVEPVNIPDHLRVY